MTYLVKKSEILGDIHFIARKSPKYGPADVPESHKNVAQKYAPKSAQIGLKGAKKWPKSGEKQFQK